MLAHKRQTHRVALCGLFISLISIAPRVASAQDQPRSNVVLVIAKAVVFDPTTYAPATFSYTAQRMDWNTSQTLFQHGWLEHNDRFTISGRADDTPLSLDHAYGAAALAGVSHQ